MCEHPPWQQLFPFVVLHGLFGYYSSHCDIGHHCEFVDVAPGVVLLSDPKGVSQSLVPHCTVTMAGHHFMSTFNVCGWGSRSGITFSFSGRARRSRDGHLESCTCHVVLVQDPPPPDPRHLLDPGPPCLDLTMSRDGMRSAFTLTKRICCTTGCEVHLNAVSVVRQPKDGILAEEGCHAKSECWHSKQTAS